MHISDTPERNIATSNHRSLEGLYAPTRKLRLNVQTKENTDNEHIYETPTNLGYVS